MKRARFAIAHDLAARLASQVSDLSPAELRSLRRSLQNLTTTNCWWLIYELRRVLDDLAENEQHSRRKAS